MTDRKEALGIWKSFSGDFNSCTDEEIEQECQDAMTRLDEAEAWLEAVEDWKLAGKPRCALIRQEGE